MRVISQRKIKDFYGQPGNGEAKIPLLHWYNTVANRDYRSFSQIREDFRDTVRENGLCVFNLEEGRYKIATSIYFDTGCVYVRFVGTTAASEALVDDRQEETRQDEHIGDTI